MTLQLTGADWHGSPMLSHTSGTSTTHTWSAFGGGTNRTGAAALIPGFNGERQDPLSGVTHLGNGYRAYSPVLRRFTCPDSESPFGIGGINPYAYCESDPINKTDPSGHGPITWLIRKIIGLSVRAGIKAAISDGASASLATAGTVETGVELAASAVTGQASRAVAKTNPHAAKALGWMSLGLGIAGTFGVAEILAPQMGRKIKGLSQKIARTIAEPGQRITPRGGVAINTGSLTGEYNFIQYFEDTYKNGRRLNIDAHGRFDKSYGSGLIKRGDIHIDPLDLVRLLENNGVNIEEYQAIRLVVCHSGDGGVDSFAAELSRLTNKTVKGYKGIVSASEWFESERQLEPGEFGRIPENGAYEISKRRSEISFFDYPCVWLKFRYKPVLVTHL
ncbi:RHS repeat-associated core domain-containing protein [Trabulsiella odontotermitis]|uniref:RHS repeat-associated core domain-containing protein n=1 Tax=Trabulsiella odontotermitis TaxID=379893 RepID=UPI003ABE0BF2